MVKVKVYRIYRNDRRIDRFLEHAAPANMEWFHEKYLSRVW
jgi:hypothetical protein